MLDLIWFAKFKDGSTIQQFEDIKNQKQEKAFKEVLDRQEELEQFALMNIEYNHIYTVDLVNGIIGINSEYGLISKPDEDMLRNNSYKYRLIYFRRVSRTFGLDLSQVGNTDIIYYLGFQYNLKDGSNIKRLMKIDKSGRVIIN